ncbi:LysR family transcriptional regulator [Rhizobium sp. AN80A]|uniref:LysR family transcriptional regulator n=1 Tax=Rhizobium sp. AN80A TaxID=3040673 RepID=UPI0032C4170F
MARRLPPLTTLPAFDAAARHLSFTKAAAELNVTHGAISRAVRHLEDGLGVRLFDRGTRSVELTAEGLAYAAEVGAALDRISVATMATAASRSSGVLNVSTSDGFAGRWLVPRLHRFHRPTPISTCASQRPECSPTSSGMESTSRSAMAKAITTT